MTRTVLVSIWSWQGLGFTIKGPEGGHWGSVGHCMLSEPGLNDTLLSQFPHEYGPNQPSLAHGKNVRFTVPQTRDTENRDPSVVFQFDIDNDRELAFKQAIQNQLDTPFWDWNPMPPYETHCARSVYEALIAAGVPIDPSGAFTYGAGHRQEILPNMLWYLLERIGTPTVGPKEPNLDLATIKDNTRLVRFAREENLWA